MKLHVQCINDKVCTIKKKKKLLLAFTYVTEPAKPGGLKRNSSTCSTAGRVVAVTERLITTVDVVQSPTHVQRLTADKIRTDDTIRYWTFTRAGK